jgi:hypothetical protein
MPFREESLRGQLRNKYALCLPPMPFRGAPFATRNLYGGLCQEQIHSFLSPSVLLANYFINRNIRSSKGLSHLRVYLTNLGTAII